jgi:glutathione S-transferase
MKLYGFLVSPYVARVVLAARAKGITLAAEPPPGGNLKSPEYLALNPMGKIPTLVVDGRALPESMVILDYLEDAHPDRPLLPGNALDRAQVRLLARIVDLYVVPTLGTFFGNMNPATRNADAVEGAKKSLNKALDDLEHFMGTGPYAFGGSLGYADAAILPVLLMVRTIVAGFGVTDLIGGRPKLAKWMSQMQADAVAGPFIAEYDAATQAFLASRRG